MYICSYTQQDNSQVKKIWLDVFGDSDKFADFALSICDEGEIYLLKEEDKVISMAIAGIDVEAYGKKGFYIYGVCTVPEYRKKGYAKLLLEHICKTKLEKDYSFAITQPANDRLFEFYKNLGFNTISYIRKCNIDIKKNIWKQADFDTVTASRFKEIRNKFSNDEVVHFTSQGYQKFTEYVYSEGASTAETERAYCMYFEQGDKLIVRDMFAQSTSDAVSLLQAIRERTGKEVAQVELSQNSTLFLGEGQLYKHCVIKNLDEEVYANIMFD